MNMVMVILEDEGSQRCRNPLICEFEGVRLKAGISGQKPWNEVTHHMKEHELNQK